MSTFWIVVVWWHYEWQTTCDDMFPIFISTNIFEKETAKFCDRNVTILTLTHARLQNGKG